MGKVYPRSPSLSSASTSKGKTFTIWMKSLVYHANGCTVFDSDGHLVYRVDNYDKTCSNEVHLMDLGGQILFTIRKKKLSVFGCWDGYRWTGSEINEKPCFHVRKLCRTLMGDLACQISTGFHKYWIVRMADKEAFRMVDGHGEVVAEAKRKLSSSGVLLGNDVLTLEVKPCMDHSFIMAVVTVYGLIRRQL